MSHPFCKASVLRQSRRKRIILKYSGLLHKFTIVKIIINVLLTECAIISTLEWNSFSLLYTNIYDIVIYFQQAYSQLIMFSYYTLQTKNFIRVIEKLKIAHPCYLFGDEYRMWLICEDSEMKAAFIRSVPLKWNGVNSV